MMCLDILQCEYMRPGLIGCRGCDVYPGCSTNNFAMKMNKNSAIQ